MNGKIFTVGQVWTEFVKRLPRTTPRFKGDPQPFQMFRGLGSILTDDQVKALSAQQAQSPFSPHFQPYQASSSPPVGGFFNIIGL